MGKSLVAHVGKQSVGLIRPWTPDNKPLTHQPRPQPFSLAEAVLRFWPPVHVAWSGQVMGRCSRRSAFDGMHPDPNTIVCPVSTLASDWSAQICAPLWLVGVPAALLVLAGSWPGVECSGGRRGNPEQRESGGFNSLAACQRGNQPSEYFRLTPESRRSLGLGPRLASFSRVTNDLKLAWQIKTCQSW